MRAYKMSNGNLLIPILVKGGMYQGPEDVISVGMEVVMPDNPIFATWSEFVVEGAAIDAEATEPVAKAKLHPAMIAQQGKSKPTSPTYLFPDEKAFPINKPHDIAAALAAWDDYGGEYTRSQFHKKLVEIATSKGFAYVNMLPENLRPKTSKTVSKEQAAPNIGGGRVRSKLADSDFVFPDERKFPIVTTGDIKDAVASWGRYNGPAVFDSFKKNLTALARKKGKGFLEALPASWDVK